MPCRLRAPTISRLCRLYLVAALLALTACSDHSGQTAATQGPPPAVIAAAARQSPINQQSEFVGRVVAVDRVELRARVQGFLKEMRFTEGQRVAAGDILFVIEPDQFEAQVAQRKADATKAEAEAENAVAQLARGEELLKSKNISAAEIDKLRAAASIAKAGIAQAEAALAAAELDLSYTEIKAPVAGRIGLARYTVGNLVGPDSGPLATLVSSDPIHLQFPLTQREVLEARRDIQARGGDPKDMVVQARLPDGSLYGQSGRLNFIDVTTDPGTDSVTVRAQIPNPDGTLVDGQFVSVVLQAATPETALLIPQSALQIDQQGVFVLLIDGDSKAQVRRIQTGPTVGAMIAVKEGLSEGDLVITEGTQKARPGQEVTATPPQTIESPAAAPAAPATE